MSFPTQVRGQWILKNIPEKILVFSKVHLCLMWIEFLLDIKFGHFFLLWNFKVGLLFLLPLEYQWMDCCHGVNLISFLTINSHKRENISGRNRPSLCWPLRFFLYYTYVSNVIFKVHFQEENNLCLYAWVIVPEVQF